MNAHVRTFTDRPAVREQVPLLIGLVGPSGSGKTYSALRLATGIQSVTGGDIFFIDTEARRALHYAGDGPGKFKFRHIEFGAPFGSLDYLAAIRHCADLKAGVIVVDSMSHEHEGPGGLIDAHDIELTRMAGQDYGKRERMAMLAWQKPKAARRALLNGIVQLGVSCIMCFRAGEKTKPIKGPDGKVKPVEMGFSPIAGPEFVYEMTASVLLYPRSDGVPTLASHLPGENVAIKVPGQFRQIIREGEPLTEALGASLAHWARGGATPAERAESIDLPAILIEGQAAAERGSTPLTAWWQRLTKAEKAAAKPTLDDEFKAIAARADQAALDDDNPPDTVNSASDRDQGERPGVGDEPTSVDGPAAAALDDGFPGDRPAPLTLAQRVEAFKVRCADAPTSIKLQSIGRAAGDLRRDLDAKDPDLLAEMDAWFDERLRGVEEIERNEARA